MPSSLLRVQVFMAFSLKNHKNHDYRAAFGVCKVKNRLNGGF
jgi:hypothetical protein